MEVSKDKFSTLKLFKNDSSSKENQLTTYKKLTNTKLFQRFLCEETAKPKPNPKNFEKSISPSKKYKIEMSPLKVEQCIQTPLDISMESGRLNSEQSEIQGFSQHIYANSPDKQYPQYPYYPMYMLYPIEAFKDPIQEKLKEENEKMRQEFIQIINEKDSEIQKLRKDLENSRLDVIELEDKLRDIGGEDVQELEKRMSVLIQQNQKLLEVNRTINAEAKGKFAELESDLRMSASRNEDLLKDLMREREKNEMIDTRFNTIKERSVLLENANIQAQDRILSLEKELDTVYRDLNQSKKRGYAERNEYFDISPNTARNDYYECIPNTARNFYEEYSSRPREQTMQDDSMSSYKNQRNNFTNQNEQTVNRLRNTQEKSPLQRQSLDQKLDSLINDKQRLEKEYSKLPEVCKNISSKRRKEELELELEILDTNIHNIKSKIRNKSRGN